VEHPSGTVRFAEPLVAAVHRVALDEINTDVVIDELQGYIEYPSHTRQGIDSPVGLAFCTHLPPGETLATVPPSTASLDSGREQRSVHLSLLLIYG
jgi:hypothetical protein